MVLNAHREGLGRGVAAVAFLATLIGSLAAAAQPPVAYPGRPTLRVVYETTPNPPRHLGVGTAIDWERPGLTLDLIKGVGERLRLNLAFERMPWKRGLLLIETGDADAIFHTSYLAGREAAGAFPKTANGEPDASRALFSQSYVLFAPAGSPVAWDGTAITGLAGRPVGATAGYAVIDHLRARGIPVEAVRLPRLNLAKLVEGRIAAYAELENLATALIRHDPERYGSIVRVGPPLLTKPYHLMLSRSFVRRDPALAEAIWSAIPEVRESAAFRRREAVYADTPRPMARQ